MCNSYKIYSNWGMWLCGRESGTAQCNNPITSQQTGLNHSGAHYLVIEMIYVLFIFSEIKWPHLLMGSLWRFCIFLWLLGRTYFSHILIFRVFLEVGKSQKQHFLFLIESYCFPEIITGIKLYRHLKHRFSEETNVWFLMLTWFVLFYCFSSQLPHSSWRTQLTYMLMKPQTSSSSVRSQAHPLPPSNGWRTEMPSFPVTISRSL